MMTGGDWTEISMFTAASVCYNYMASLYLRVVAMWDDFPYRLVRLVNDATEQAERERIAAQLLRLDRCCLTPTDGFTWV